MTAGLPLLSGEAIFSIPVATPLLCTVVHPFTLARRAHSTILKRLIGDKGECDSGAETEKVKELNLHNCFQFTEVPCVNKEKYDMVY